ncbi:stage II sporulation protein M [Weissella minor]|uniref:stage II sporulation protein M n=1 Tax=Weissella minor TaxID=1620 RepID=UPI003AF2532B
MKKLSIQIVIAFVLWISLTVVMYYLFFKNAANQTIPIYPNQGINHSLDILLHNIAIFFITVIGFVVSPIIVVLNNTSLAVSIAANAGNFGWENTFKLLLPHALVEIPTILLYQQLSLNMLFLFTKHKDFQSVFKYFYANKFLFLAALVGVLVGAFIEGIIG